MSQTDDRYKWVNPKDLAPAEQNEVLELLLDHLNLAVYVDHGSDQPVKPFVLRPA